MAPLEETFKVTNRDPERLREFVGDDDLLRVSFKRYDTDQSGALDAGEIFAATQEVLRVSDEQAADAFTLQDARDQVEAYDRDGNGSLNFREFKKMFRKLIKVASGGGGGGGGGGRK